MRWQHRGRNTDRFGIARLNSDGGTVEASILPQTRMTILKRHQGIQLSRCSGVIGTNARQGRPRPRAPSSSLRTSRGAALLLRTCGRRYAVTSCKLNDFAQDRSVFETGGEFTFAGNDGTRTATSSPGGGASCFSASRRRVLALHRRDVNRVDVRPPSCYLRGASNDRSAIGHARPSTERPGRSAGANRGRVAGLDAGLDRARPHEVFLPCGSREPTNSRSQLDPSMLGDSSASPKC